MRLYILSGAVITFMFIDLMTPQVYAQSLSPLEEDQDGDGDPLNEEYDIRADCYVDVESSKRLSDPTLIEPTLSEDDCNFAMHYLSGQCEELTAIGVNVTMVCDDTLAYYLRSQQLYTKDFPTDIERFNSVLAEFKQNEASEEQERAQEEAQEEANNPSWAENLE
jgi:hypothetical protein